MRRLTRGAVIATALVLTVTVLAACSSDDDEPTTAARENALAERTVEAGEVTVKITPETIDDGAAAFDVVFDTHSVELDLDVAANAQLTVDGTDWPVAGWDGAGPGGHHREGTIRFDSGGTAAGTARLTIDGLPEPVEASWTLEGG